MGNNNLTFTEKIVENIRKILIYKDMKQATAALYMEVSPSQFSRILQGKVTLSMEQLSRFANGAGMREIDVITWPDVYEANKPSQRSEPDPVEAVLQIRLQSDKKDQVLKLIFGENNIEILNR
uniref:helix-turn-helix domain-containing protein n=1 Tax=Alistipes sp. TaxID=1872444 RepID=UPI00405688DF